MGAAPILYSFRRCPYAIRARLALAAAGLRPQVDLELRELHLKAKPHELLEASAKGTVPVLTLPAGQVLDESLAIMRWALERADPAGWWAERSGGDRAAIEALTAENDGPFKHHLDRYRYPDRHPGESSSDHHAAGIAILRTWSTRLESGGWLLSDRCSLADAALLPFVRQFRQTDPERFDAEPDLGALHIWLARFLVSPELRTVIEPPWAWRCPWPSPRWLYHLALADDWREARTTGVYNQSSRGLSLETVGFVHASAAHQIGPTLRRFYGDLPAEALRLLALDPGRLASAGVEVRWEPAPESGELFPHLYAGLPLEAVLWSEVPGR
jgi:glutathione S-transferase